MSGQRGALVIPVSCQFQAGNQLFNQSNQENIMRLRHNQLCPIHRSQFCCGRESIPREKRPRQMGVRRIEDPHHPRGYRELRSKRRNVETPRPEDCRPAWQVRPL